MMKKFKALEPEKVSKEKEMEFVNRLVSATDAIKKLTESTGFDVWVTWHLVLLLAGLVIYVLAQTLGG
jgi:hypothetical protein